jgi:ribonuclease-3
MPFVKRLSQEEKARISELRRLQTELKYRFRDLSLLDQALTHSSFSHEQSLQGKDYERMEFLGDSILGMVISEYLFRQFPFFTEGQLTKLKSQIVSTSTLATLGKTLHLEDFLRMGRGEAMSLGPSNSSTSFTTNPLFLAGALEAIVAAVYLDGGLRPANRFILSHFKLEIQRIEEGKGKRDYKSMLQELTLKRFKSTPHYAVISETGSQYQKQFDIQVTIEGKLYGCGSGRNKKSAEQQAAKEALTKFMAL